MTIQQDIQNFIEELEVYAKRKLNYPVEIGELLQIVQRTGFVGEFEDLIFQAKVLVRTQELMKRIGPGGEGLNNLSREFQSSLQKLKSILKNLAGKAPETVMQQFTTNFFFNETESFHRLMSLIYDLSWIKNWQLDGKELPYEEELSIQKGLRGSAHQKRLREKSFITYVQIQRSIWMSTILFLLFLLVDPPVTILGWILSLWISAFLVYIILQIRVITRSPKQ